VLLIKYYLGDQIRRMKWAGRVTQIGEFRRVLVGKSEEKKDQLEDLGVDGSRVFKRIFKK